MPETGQRASEGTPKRSEMATCSYPPQRFRELGHNKNAPVLERTAQTGSFLGFIFGSNFLQKRGFRKLMGALKQPAAFNGELFLIF